MSSIKVEEQIDSGLSSRAGGASTASPHNAAHAGVVRQRQSRHKRTISESALDEITKHLPSEFLQASTRRAFLGLFSSVAVLTVAYWLMAISPWFLLPLFWAVLGAAYAGIHSVNSECSRGSFSRFPVINSIVGNIVSLPLLMPFESVRLQDKARLISSAYEACAKSNWSWPFSSTVGWLRANFNLVTVFKSGNRTRIIISLVSLYIFALVFFPVMQSYLGWWGLFKFYIIPYVAYHFWMSTFISFAYRIPFTTGASLRVSIAFPTKFPAWLDFLTNDINDVLTAARSIQESIPNHKIKGAFEYLRSTLSEQMDSFASAVTEHIGALSSDDEKEESPSETEAPLIAPEKSSTSSTADPQQQSSENTSLLSQINWHTAIFIIVTPMIWLYGAFTTPLMWQTFVWALITYHMAGLGITVGYHRHFSHRTYDLGPVMRFFMLMCGTMAFEGSALWWSRDHRAHHRYVDTDKDPYNAKRGFFYAHVGWLLVKQDRTKIGKADTVDLDEDPLLQWQDKYFIPLAILTGIIIPTCIAGWGWGDWRGGFFFASIARAVFLMQATFCVNSAAHYFGDHTFTDEHTPRDSWWVSLITFGEGYHNFHHEFPYDYRNGTKSYNYDPSKWVIWALGKLGLAHNLKRFPENEVRKGEMQMTRKRLDRLMNRLDWGPQPETMPSFTMDEVKRRCANEGTALIVVDGFVHDVMHFVDDHPGGKALIRTFIGKDASNAFHGGVYGHSNGARNLLTTFRVGRIEGAELIERSYGRPSAADAAAAEACFAPSFIAKKL